MTRFERNAFARDRQAMLALADARKAENAAARARCQANPELVQILAEQAARRGQPGIDWHDYFLQLGIS